MLQDGNGHQFVSDHVTLIGRQSRSRDGQSRVIVNLSTFGKREKETHRNQAGRAGDNDLMRLIIVGYHVEPIKGTESPHNL